MARWTRCLFIHFLYRIVIRGHPNLSSPCFRMVENKGGKVSDHEILQIYSKYLAKKFACCANFRMVEKKGRKGSDIQRAEW